MKYVHVTFQGSDKEYTYLNTRRFIIHPGDLVVVRPYGEYKVVQVQDVSEDTSTMGHLQPIVGLVQQHPSNNQQIITQEYTPRKRKSAPKAPIMLLLWLAATSVAIQAVKVGASLIHQYSGLP